MENSPASFSVFGNYVDIKNRTIYPAEVKITAGKIDDILPLSHQDDLPQSYILPGFIDSHVHIESSMLVPSEFARLAVVHGTVATVSDPHEIANVCGVQGVDFMIDNGNQVPFKFYFGAPSCVPATHFETAGAHIDARGVEQLLERKEVKYLSEMMNFPGVLNNDEEVMEKIAIAKKWNKPIDGHAPGLRGTAVQQYIDAGISTDHECFTAEEALEKLDRGMKILIREGSAAKNFDALAVLLQDYANDIMFCSDDKHPDSLVEGHINKLCARAVAEKFDVFNVLQAACINPVEHYGLDVGLLQPGQPADLIVVTDLVDFKVEKTYINGQLVADNGQTLIQSVAVEPLNHFNCNYITADDIVYSGLIEQRHDMLPVIGVLDGQLITEHLRFSNLVLRGPEGFLQTNTDEDILKIVVINRYHPAPPAIAFIKNFGLKKGAIASSVAHDSHNIIAVGVDDEAICHAINLVIEDKGGISCVGNGFSNVISLPVGGLMSTMDGYSVAAMYTRIDAFAKQLGCQLSAPFMTLSFMGLLVIPALKLSDKGLFDGTTFQFVDQ